MVRNFTARRAGGSETALRSQPGSHEVALSEPGFPPKILLANMVRNFTSRRAGRGLRGNRGVPLFPPEISYFQAV